MRLFTLIAVFVLFLAGLTGCDLEIEIKNSTPVVTWVAAAPVADGVVDVTVWIFDMDRDPVDVAVTWSLDGVEQGPIDLAPGGHGTLGLTTDATALGDDGRPVPEGQPHLLRWALPEGVPQTASLQLAFSPDDRVAPVGQMHTSPSFTPASGLPAATALETR